MRHAGTTNASRGQSGVRDTIAAIFVLLRATVVIAMALAPATTAAHSYKLGDIAVGHVWAPPPEPGAEGLPVYGPILNRGKVMMQLVGVSTPVAERVRLRRMKDGEVTWPNAVDLRPGKPLALAAWREHIWLSGLKELLKEGYSFDLTLDFGEGGQLTVKFVIEKASGH